MFQKDVVFMSQKVPYKQSKVSPGPIHVQEIDLNFNVVYAKT